MKSKTILLALFLIIGLVGVQAATFDISSTYTPAPANPGELITIWATITNNSNDIANNVEVTMDSSYPFSISDAGKSKTIFDEILPFQSKVAKLEVQTAKDALNGNYSIILQLKENNQSRIGKELQISVLAIKPQIEMIESQNTTGHPGQVIETTLTLRNIGSSTAKNILVGTSEDRSVTSTGVVVDRPIKNIGPSLAFLEILEPNETATLQLEMGIDSSAEQKTHSVPISITYQDTNRAEYTITRYLGVLVRAQAQLDGTIVADHKTAFPGSTTEFTVNIFNRGSATARNVVVTLETPENIQIITEKKVFIGTLDPDDFDSFNVTATVAANTPPAEIPIKILFDYKDQDFTSEGKIQYATLKVVSTAEAQQNGGDGLLGNLILIIIILVIIYFVYKRFKKKK